MNEFGALNNQQSQQQNTSGPLPQTSIQQQLMSNANSFGDLMTPHKNIKPPSRINGMTMPAQSSRSPHDFTTPGLSGIQQTSQFNAAAGNTGGNFDQNQYMQQMFQRQKSPLPGQQPSSTFNNQNSRNQTFQGALGRSKSPLGGRQPGGSMYISQPNQTFQGTQEAPMLSPVNGGSIAGQPPAQSYRSNLIQQQVPDMPPFGFNQSQPSSRASSFVQGVPQQQQQQTPQQQLNQLLLQQQQQQQMSQQSFMHQQQQQMSSEVLRNQPNQPQQQFNNMGNSQQQPQNFDQIQLLAQMLQNQSSQNQFNGPDQYSAALLQQLQLLQSQQQRQAQGMFYPPQQQNQPSALNQQISANVDNYKRLVANFFQNQNGPNQNIQAQLSQANSQANNSMQSQRAPLHQLQRTQGSEQNINMSMQQPINQSSQLLQQNYDSNNLLPSQSQLQQLNQHGHPRNPQHDCLPTDQSQITGMFQSPNNSHILLTQPDVMSEPRNNDNLMTLPVGIHVNNVQPEKQAESTAMNRTASNSKLQNMSYSGIKNDDEHRKISTDRITKVDEMYGENSAIMETNQLLGALNGGTGAGQMIERDQHNLSSSFLKNNESGNVDNQADEKSAEPAGIMWLSSAPTQAPPVVTKDGRESPCKTVSGTASTDRPTNISEDFLAPQNMTKQDIDSARIDQEPIDQADKSEETLKTPVANADCIEEQPLISKQLTFEEMLEAQLQKSGVNKENEEEKQNGKEERPGSVRPSEGDPDEVYDGAASPKEKKEKKAFLRRGSSNKYNPNPTALKKQVDTAKKYKYYADNFSSAKPPVESEFDVIEVKQKGRLTPTPSVRSQKEPETPEHKPIIRTIKKSPTKSKLNTTPKPDINVYQVNKNKSKDDKEKSITAKKETKQSKNDDDKQSVSSKQSQQLQPSASRLKFNVAKDSIKSNDKAETCSEHTKSTKPKRNVADEQKRPTSVRQNNKQLFKKQTKKDKSSPEKKDKITTFNSQDVAKKDSILEKNATPKKMKSDQISKATINVNKSVTDQGSGTNNDTHCYTDRQSILEFEMLEQECFGQEKPQNQVFEMKNEVMANQAVKQELAKAENIEILNAQSPAKLKEELLQQIITSPQSIKSDNCEGLEKQLMALIQEQEQEVAKLHKENQRVASLQNECQKQLERLNKESLAQETSRSQNRDDFTKLKHQLKQKDLEMINMQEQMLTVQDSNHKLKSINQGLNEQLDELSDRLFTSATTQTVAPNRRNVLTNTSTPCKKVDAENQTERCTPPSKSSRYDPHEALETPSQHLQTRIDLEEESILIADIISPQVSPRNLRESYTPKAEKSTISEDQLNQNSSNQNSFRTKWDNGELTLASEREGIGKHDSPAYKVSLISKAVRVASVAKRDSPTQANQKEQKHYAEMKAFTQDGIQEEDEDSFTLAEKQAEHFASNHEDDMPIEQPQNKLLTEVEEVTDMFDATGKLFNHEDGEGEVESVSETSDEYDLVFPDQYHSDEVTKTQKLVEEFISPEGKIQRIYDSGKKEVVFPNGVKREVWPDGYQVVFFQNNDIKQSFKGGKICYFFSDAKTTQTTFPDGIQVFKFQNNQIEKHFTDGTKEISFPDGTVKCLYPDGEEESIFPDGTIQKIEKTGVRCIEYPHGQRDFMYPDGTKVREYADGTIKKVNPNGNVETIHPQNDQEAKEGNGDQYRPKE